MITFKTFSNGDVEVKTQYEVFESLTDSEIITDISVYREIGAYVYKVYSNGTTSQVCEGMKTRGPTLHSSCDGNLEGLLRKIYRNIT